MEYLLNNSWLMKSRRRDILYEVRRALSISTSWFLESLIRTDEADMDSEDDTETYIHAESSLRGSIDDHLSSIPLIRPSPQGSILIPPDPPTGYEDHKAKPAYEVVVQLGLDSDLRGRSAYLYQSRVSSGQTCDVYEVDARWAWSTVPDAAYDGRNTVKVCILLDSIPYHHMNVCHRY